LSLNIISSIKITTSYIVHFQTADNQLNDLLVTSINSWTFRIIGTIFCDFGISSSSKMGNQTAREIVLLGTSRR